MMKQTLRKIYKNTTLYSYSYIRILIRTFVFLIRTFVSSFVNSYSYIRKLFYYPYLC